MNAMTQRATYWFHRVLMTVLVVLVVACTIAIGREVLAPASSSPVEPTNVPGSEHGSSLGETGHVPEDTTIFDDSLPGIANLDPDLLDALRETARDAEDDGIEFTVNSGWRSPEYQAQLLDDAVDEYGSKEEAARWVATPENSPHVSGDAVDIGPPRSAEWLGEHGDDYGLCQIYRNEPWHFELRPDADDEGCPRRYADPTQDPRMR